MFLYKVIFGIKKLVLALLTTLINSFIISNASNHAKNESLSNQKCQTETTLINLRSNEYSQELHYYPFAVKLDQCVGSCKTLNNLSNKSCVPNKTEDFIEHTEQTYMFLI